MEARHAIQAYATNGTAISPVASFSVAPSFSVSPLSGPAGSPINVVGTGLGIGVYSTTYCLHWDNNVVGYMSAVSTGGVANFTFYASGTPGTHFISIFHCNTGPGYFNPDQVPISVSDYDPPYIPFYTNYTVTPENVVLSSASSTTNDAFTTHGAAPVSSLALVGVSLFAGMGLFVFARKDREERKAISKAVIAVAIIVIIVIGGVGLYATMKSDSGTDSTTQTSSGQEVVFSPVATVLRPQITVPVNNATTGPHIEVTPTIASVGDNITVSGAGFAPNQQLPLVMTDRVGSNLAGLQAGESALRERDHRGGRLLLLNDKGASHFGRDPLHRRRKPDRALQRHPLHPEERDHQRDLGPRWHPDSDSDVWRRMGLQHQHSHPGL